MSGTQDARSTSTSSGFPFWAIIVVASVGGVAIIVVLGLLLRYRLKRQHAEDLGEEFPPFQRYAINRGRAVPTSWNLSMSHILGLTSDRESFMALEDNFTGGRRRSTRSKRSIFSRRISISSHRSKTPMSQAPPTPTLAAISRPATKAGNRDFLGDLDAAFVSKSPRQPSTTLLPTPSPLGKEIGFDSPSGIERALSPLELGSFADSISPFSDTGLDKETDPLNRRQQSKQSIHPFSLPHSRYSTLSQSERTSTAPPPPLSRQKSTPNLTVVVEDTARSPIPTPPKSPPSLKRPKSSNTTPAPAPTPAQDSEPSRRPSVRVKNVIRPNLKPITVPPPVLAAREPDPPAPLTPGSPLTPKLARQIRRLSRAPPSPSNQSTFSDLSSTYTVLQARPAVRVSGMNQSQARPSPPPPPPPDLPSHPRYTHLSSALNLSSSSFLTQQSTASTIPSSPDERRRSRSGKKGQVLRKKSLKRAESTRAAATATTAPPTLGTTATITAGE